VAVFPTNVLVGVVAGAAAVLAGCGGDSNQGASATQPTASTATTTAAPPERPVTIKVNGERRAVTLSKVDARYCARRTDVCAAIRGGAYARVSAEGKRAVRAARRRKAARQRQEELQRQQQQQQQQQQAPPQPPPQPQTEGTTTG
jgi:hypothetical protein